VADDSVGAERGGDLGGEGDARLHGHPQGGGGGDNRRQGGQQRD
jgi:hypothetical protein